MTLRSRRVSLRNTESADLRMRDRGWDGARETPDEHRAPCREHRPAPRGRQRERRRVSLLLPSTGRTSSDAHRQPARGPRAEPRSREGEVLRSSRGSGALPAAAHVRVRPLCSARNGTNRSSMIKPARREVLRCHTHALGPRHRLAAPELRRPSCCWTLGRHGAMGGWTRIRVSGTMLLSVVVAALIASPVPAAGRGALPPVATSPERSADLGLGPRCRWHLPWCPRTSLARSTRAPGPW